MAVIPVNPHRAGRVVLVVRQDVSVGYQSRRGDAQREIDQRILESQVGRSCRSRDFGCSVRGSRRRAGIADVAIDKGIIGRPIGVNSNTGIVEDRIGNQRITKGGGEKRQSGPAPVVVIDIVGEEKIVGRGVYSQPGSVGVDVIRR